MLDRDAEFRDYFARRAVAMRSTAFLLCGDWHQAEDLVQVAFLKVYRAWDRIAAHDAMDAYVRKVLTRTFLDDRRRKWYQRVQLTDALPDIAAPPDTSDERLEVLRALAAVPPKQRAVLVLRYWSDLSIEETARTLGCSTGNVKSQAARGLQTVRAALADRDAVPPRGSR